MTTPGGAQRIAAERWLLAGGLPAVLRPGVLVGWLWSRSAPALAAFALMMTSSALIVLVTGKTTIDIGGTPTRGEWFVLAVVVLVLPVAAATGWLVSRITSTRGRGVASSVSLTVLVFFNTYVWLMAEIVSRTRLWMAVGFLFLIAATFLTSSKIVQVLAVAMVTAAIFFVLGLILLSPPLLVAWTRNGSSDGQFLGMTFPVPGALIQITPFLGALTFMYVSARAVSDSEHRPQFLDPMIDNLRLALVARDRYRTYTATD